MEKNNAKTSNVKYFEVRKITSLKDMFNQAFTQAADKIAYSYNTPQGVVDITYGEVETKMNALGAFLHAVGADGAHISCIGPNSFNWILVYLTTLRSGAVFVPIDKDLPQNDMLHILEEGEAETVFVTDKYENILRESGEIPSRIKRIINFEREEDDGIYLSFAKALEMGAALDPSGFLNHERTVDEMKMIVYTSGTTGVAKGVMLSEKNLISSVYYGRKTSAIYTKCLSVLPYHHTYEAVSGLLNSFHEHSTVCINEGMLSVVRNLQLFKPDYIFIVPALAEMFYTRVIRSLKKDGKYDNFMRIVSKSRAARKFGIDVRAELFVQMRELFGGNLRKIVCGGAAVRPAVAKFYDDIGIDFVIGYGITECSPLVSVNNDFDIDIGTAGIPLPCLQVKIDAPNEDGVGEICVKGDSVMMGYYKRPDLTAEVMYRGWFYTGDYGYINENGHIVICGRKKNVIVLSNGKNVYPEEIEGYIQEIDYVSEVVVSGDTDNNGNESSLTAEVFLSEVKTSSEVLKAIKNACKNLPIYKQISSVRIRDKEFEKTSSQKIKRFGKKKHNEAKEEEETQSEEKKD